MALFIIGETFALRGLFFSLFKTSSQRESSRSDCPVHPHSRGAYGILVSAFGGSLGSSPLAWGILCGDQFLVYGVRFIPTRVGHTQFLRFLPPPHLRFIPTRVGHTLICVCRLSVTAGSSPLAWGILVKVQFAEPSETVHPHSRGAYHINAIPLRRRVWFIPTRVGHTHAHSSVRFT